MMIKIKRMSWTWIHYILIYILIIFQGSVFFKNYQDYFYLGTLFIFACYCLRKKRLIDRQYFAGVLMLVMLLLFTVVLSKGSLAITSILNILSRFLLIYIVYDYDREMFCNRYILLMSALAFISLIFFGLQRIDPDIIRNIFPGYKNAGEIYRGTFIFTMAPTHLRRNVGIMAEPGLYQIILSSGLFMLLYMKSQLNLTKRQYAICFAVLLVALVTAQSTTGYFSAIILMGFYFVRLDQKETVKYRVLLIFLIICFLAWDLANGEDGLIYKRFIVKLFNKSGQLDLTVSTGRARYYSMLADIAIANKYPFGAGYEIYASLWRSLLQRPLNDVASCVGLTYSLATLGYINTIYVLGFYLWLMRKNFSDIYMKMAYILLFINTSLAQPSIFFTAMMVPLLINCKKSRTDLKGAKV